MSLLPQPLKLVPHPLDALLHCGLLTLTLVSTAVLAVRLLVVRALAGFLSHLPATLAVHDIAISVGLIVGADAVVRLALALRWRGEGAGEERGDGSLLQSHGC